MASHDTQNITGWTGRRLGIGESDDFAVEFDFHTNIQGEAIVRQNGFNETCQQATWCNRVHTDLYDGIGHEEWSS
ncbi:hypothetical protein ACFVJ8_04035 [Streptomyces yangpuensis]|uniref:hypothetical protein n=1 Tax=Streptomyces yangpuensis TaxID=1648182 RepID=UPI003626C3AB